MDKIELDYKPKISDDPEKCGDCDFLDIDCGDYCGLFQVFTYYYQNKHDECKKLYQEAKNK